MTDVFVVPEPLLQPTTAPYEPRQVQVVKYGDHCRAMCELERRVDTAYHQRNNATVALVRMALLLGWPAGRGLDDKTGRHVVYLDLPNGEQVSYHMAPADVPLLDGLPEYAGKWDRKFTGTSAWAEMVPTASERCTWCGGPEFDSAEVDELMKGVSEGEMVPIMRIDCTAWPKPIYTRPFNGFDLSAAEEAQLGAVRTGEGLTVRGLTFGPETRITHGVPPATELQVSNLGSAGCGWPPSCARLDCAAPHEPDSPYCKEHRND